MPDKKPMVVYAAIYGGVSAAQTDLDAIEALHKDKVIGSFDAAVIDQEDGKPHGVKRMERPGVRVIPEWFGGGTLPRKELHELAEQLTASQAGLIAVGEEAAPILAGARRVRSWTGEALAVLDGAAALEALANQLKPGDVVLVKASRAAHLEGVAEALREEADR